LCACRCFFSYMFILSYEKLNCFSVTLSLCLAVSLSLRLSASLPLFLSVSRCLSLSLSVSFPLSLRLFVPLRRACLSLSPPLLSRSFTLSIFDCTLPAGIHVSHIALLVQVANVCFETCLLPSFVFAFCQ